MQNEAVAIPGYQSSMLQQIQLIMRRSLVTCYRNKGAMFGKVVPALFFALVLGVMYSNASNDQKSIQDRIGVLFFMSINQAFGNMFVSTTPTRCPEHIFR